MRSVLTSTFAFIVEQRKKKISLVFLWEIIVKFYLQTWWVVCIYPLIHANCIIYVCVCVHTLVHISIVSYILHISPNFNAGKLGDFLPLSFKHPLLIFYVYFCFFRAQLLKYRRKKKMFSVAKALIEILLSFSRLVWSSCQGILGDHSRDWAKWNEQNPSQSGWVTLRFVLD